MSDNPFRVTHKTWLTTEADRVGAMMVMPKWWGLKWDHKSLQKALSDIGLNYSIDEIAELNDELHNRGIVEDIELDEITPEPVTEPVTEPVIIDSRPR
jgi:hypothetical protein